MKKWFEDKNIELREYISERNKLLGLKECTTLLKLASYCGAIRVPYYVQKNYVCYEDATGRYLDPTNHVYKDIFLACWPDAATKLGLYNRGTIGDLVEALLGVRWLKTRDGKSIQDIEHDIIQTIEMACLHEFFLWEFEQYASH